MIREILCPECAADYWLMKIDRDRGFNMRKVNITTKAPEGDAPLKCDFCDKPLPDGTLAVACTSFRGETPPFWEDQYGETQLPNSKTRNNHN